MLEKKDYDTKIRSFDAEFYCGSFTYIFHVFIIYFHFYVKIINDTNHAREKRL